jgi:ribosomal protein S27AE
MREIAFERLMLKQLRTARSEIGEGVSKYDFRKSARGIVGYALRKGFLKKKPCEVCGAFTVVAHHDDYSAPLAVRWLCVVHHAELHIEARKCLEYFNGQLY